MVFSATKQSIHAPILDWTAFNYQAEQEEISVFA